MATQTIQFRSPPSQTVTLRLFVAGSDTQISSAAATEATNRKGTYAAAFTDLPAAEYQYIATIGTSPIIPVASGYVKLTLTTATFQTYDAAKAVNLSEVPTADAATIAAAVWAVLISSLNTIGTTGRALARLIGLVEDSSGDRLTAKSLEVIERAGGMLEAVKAKTDLITAGGVTILSPVAQDGTLNNLVAGDAYQLAAGRAIVITVTNVAAGLQAILQTPGATVHLGFLRYGKTRQNPDFKRYEFAGTIVSVGASTVVRFELTTAQTLGIVPSKYDYDIEFRQNANFVTSVANAKGKPMEWLESATELA